MMPASTRFACALCVVVGAPCVACDVPRRDPTPAVTSSASAEAPSDRVTPESGAAPVDGDSIRGIVREVPVARVDVAGPADSADPRPEARVRVDTVDGVVHVTNPSTGTWRPGEAWRVVEVFRLGAVHDPPEELFGSRIRAGLAPDGDVIVLDPLASTATVFDGNGRFVRVFGGPGQGPGELMNPTAMAWDAHAHLWIANAFDGRYTVFDSAGEMIRTVRRPVLGIADRHQLVFDRTDSFIDHASGTGSSIPFVRVDTSGAIIDTLAPLRTPDHEFPARPMPTDFDREATHYLASVKWSLAPDGTIWAAESGTLRLFQLNGRGDTLRIVETTHRDDLEIDSSTRRHVVRELAKLGSKDYTIARPVVAAIDVRDDGHLVVQIVEQVGQPSELHDIFDREGRFLGSVRFGFPVAPGGVSAFVGDTIIAVTLGELDVPYVVRAHFVH